MSTPPLISRPTKYRAWTGTNMVTVQTLCFNNGGMIWYGAGSDMGWSCVWDSPQWTVDNPKPAPEDLKPAMEWTGVLDDKGVEIYVGDIVRYERRGGVAADLGIYIAPVLWNGAHYILSREPLSTYHDAIADRWRVVTREVIGNIFENPDLLKS